MNNIKEQSLTRWLSTHHGVITTAEARRLGIDAPTLRRLAASGRLARRHQNVYAAQEVSPATRTGWLTDAAAALAAVGASAALGFGSAAWHWGWLDQPPWPVELVVPYGTTSELRRVKIHRSRVPYASRWRDGLHLTDPTRTLIDVAGSKPGLLTSVVDRAAASGLLRFADLQAATRPGGPHRLRGRSTLHSHLAWMGYLGAPAPSVLESITARLFLHYGLPVPFVEVVAGADGRYRIDFGYPHLMLAIEVDGFAWHSTAAQRDRDYARRNHLQEIGWTLRVFTWRAVVDDPGRVAAEILQAYRRLAAA